MMLSKQIRSLEDFLFPSGSDLSLGYFRIFFFLTFYLVFADTDYFLAWQNVPRELWSGQGLTEWLKPLLIAAPIEPLFWIWRIALVFACVGFFTRTSSFTVFVASFVLIAHAQSFGYFTRLFMPALWALLFLMWAPTGHRMSIDSLIRNRLNIKKSPSVSSQDYGWPFVFLRVLFCVVFFQAGLSKLINGGWDWLSGESLQNRMIHAFVWPFNPYDRILMDWNRELFSSRALCSLAAIGSVALELLCPLALWNRRLRGPLILSLAFFQIVVRFTIFVNFSGYVPLYLAWVPWERLCSHHKAGNAK